MHGDRMTCDRCEAFDAALAHARSLYTNTEQPTTEELADTVKDALFVVGDHRTVLTERERERIHAANPALSELVIRAHGHVPCEAFAAAMTALEQAEKESKPARLQLDNAALRAERDQLKRDLAVWERSNFDNRMRADQAEKERDEAVAALARYADEESEREADRDRLASELRECRDSFVEVERVAVEARAELGRAHTFIGRIAAGDHGGYTASVGEAQAYMNDHAERCRRGDPEALSVPAAQAPQEQP